MQCPRWTEGRGLRKGVVEEERMTMLNVSDDDDDDARG